MNMFMMRRTTGSFGTDAQWGYSETRIIMEDYEYIIKQKNDSVYEIHKFLLGGLETTYHVDLNHKTACDCISGRIRKYCKHKDWVHAVRHGGTLPECVTVAEEATPDKLEELLEDL